MATQTPASTSAPRRRRSVLFKLAVGALGLIVVLIGGVLAVAASKPDTVHYERSTTINAPADKIFPLIANFHEWAKWSPWEKVDPEMKRTYSGAESGVGAAYEWNGNSQIGHGRMEIVEVDAPSQVKIDLRFIEPIAGRNTALFKLEPTGDATKVTWTMDGPNPFLGKVISVLIDMDQMIGQSFEQGLAELKAAAEG